MPEDFKPFDAHQAKSLLTKNDFLAKLVVLFGIHEHILFDKPHILSFSKAADEGNETEWKLNKERQQKAMEREVDKYIFYSFTKNFQINNRDVELFEPTKILGDVFEAIIAAVYLDGGGMEPVLQVYQHLLARFILVVAKFSKQLKKEPKEDFLILAQQNKILP